MNLNKPHNKLLIKKNMESKNNSTEDDENENDEDDSDTDEANDNINNVECEDDFDINPVTFFSVKELCYYKMINKFFLKCTQEYITEMINIIESKSEMSLRVLDWFVTKYSKKKTDLCQTRDFDVFDVRISYKSQLKSYKKKYFDPFRRKKKFNYYFENGDKIKTTLGQLNFFKWAFTNDIILYVEKHLKLIIREMKISNKELDKKNKSKKQLKNNEKSTPLIKNYTTKLNKNSEGQFTLFFD
jgi:hypothetical protein